MRNKKIVSIIALVILIIIVLIVISNIRDKKSILENTDNEKDIYINEITGEYIIYDNNGLELTRTMDEEKLDLLIDNPRYNPKK